MKFIVTIPVLFLLCNLSCRQQQSPENPPTILRENKVDVSKILAKRGKDYVEALYEELVSQSDELQELEKEIQDLKKRTADSLEAFKNFNDQNSSYYSAADRKIESIGDSSLRHRIRLLVNESRSHYRDSIAGWNRIDSLIYKRNTSINNLHTILKLVKTLPLLEEFQKKEIPKKLPSQKIVADLDSLIIRLDSLSRTTSANQ